jgi:hypothetical protein
VYGMEYGIASMRSIFTGPILTLNLLLEKAGNHSAN